MALLRSFQPAEFLHHGAFHCSAKGGAQPASGESAGHGHETSEGEASLARDHIHGLPSVRTKLCLEPFQSIEVVEPSPVSARPREWEPEPSRIFHAHLTQRKRCEAE